MHTQADYQQRRKTLTIEAIQKNKGNRVKLRRLRIAQLKLADTYEEDGAIFTARDIRTIDVPLIEDAIAACVEPKK